MRSIRAVLLAPVLVLVLSGPAPARTVAASRPAAHTAPTATLATFSNTSNITINSTAAANPEPATPYPSNITVSGLSGTVTAVTVTLNNFSHVSPDDVDMLLVGPGGQTFHFWSDVGGFPPGVSNVTITVSDAGASTLPESGPLVNGTTYRPFNSSTTNDTFPSPAPGGPYNEPTSAGSATFGSVFNGLSGASVNGTWSLYVTDDVDSDAGSIAGGWSLTIDTAVPPTAIGDLIISEFRLYGPNGATDEFIELYNPKASDVVAQAADASAGLAVAAEDGAARCVIPNGTSIPAHGHYLCANSAGYSYSSYPAGNGTTATPDATYTLDIPPNAGIALFNNSTGGASFAAGTRLDAVGSTTAAALYREGAGYPALSTAGGFATIEYTLFRRFDQTTGVPVDTEDNSTDFLFADTQGLSAGAGQRLGAPGPENLSAPVNEESGISFPFVDNNCKVEGSATSACFFARDATPVTNGSQGTLSIRRKVTNGTGGALTRLRFRVIDITTFPPAPGDADLRVLSSSTFTANLTGGGTTTIQGLTLEQDTTAPNAGQPNGGGFNSSLSAGTITLGTPLASGASINVHFLLGVQSTSGDERFAVCAEGLSSSPATVEGGSCFRFERTDTPTAVAVASASALRTPGGVVVRWRSGLDARVLGYRVHRQIGAKRVLLTKRMLPTQGRFAASHYSYLDRTAPRGKRLEYWIEALQLDGKRTWMGPLVATR